MSSDDHQHDHGGADQTPTVDVLFSEEFWDRRYRSSHAVWSGDPNRQLVAEASALRPGRALDAGCGEGADAIWLALRGWKVTALDISTTALARGVAHARQVGRDVVDRITWQQADLRSWGPRPQTYELVSAQFMQLPRDLRTALHARLATGVCSGGTLIVVGHSPTDLDTTAPRPSLPELFFTAADVAASLEPSLWKVVVAEARPRQGRDPDGRPVTVHDEVVVAERNAHGVPGEIA